MYRHILLSLMCAGVLGDVLEQYPSKYYKDGLVENINSLGCKHGELPTSQSPVNGFNMQCEQGEDEHHFGDIGYALMGYNILRGYPLAIGKDPGVAQPIFVADYSDGSLTADRVHKVPKGLIAIPDVSCMTSFSSKIIKSHDDLAKSLAVSASVEGGGWGVSFSASADYQHGVHTISDGEYVYINSEARCMYYFTKLDITTPPALHPSFEKTVDDIIISGKEADIFKMFDTYGTHFAKHINFGAKFVYQHKMNSTSFKKQEKSKFGVKVSASYSGLFSAGASFSLDKEQQEAASNFSKMVETSTITVGAAPPSNGDALTWASTVKDNPMPMEQTLVSIEELFTTNYMPKYESQKAKLEATKKLIEAAKVKYCDELKKKGEVSDCHSLISIQNAAKYEQFTLEVCNPGDADATLEHIAGVKSTNDCINKCEDKDACTAVVYNADWNSCKLMKSCYSFVERASHYSYRKRTWTPAMKRAYTIIQEDRGCSGTSIFSHDKVANSEACAGECYAKSNCNAVVYNPNSRSCKGMSSCSIPNTAASTIVYKKQ